MSVYQDISFRDYALSATFAGIADHYLKFNKDTNKSEYNPKKSINMSAHKQSAIVAHNLGLFTANNNRIGFFSRTKNQIKMYTSKRDPLLNPLMTEILSHHNISNIPLHVPLSTDNLLEANRPSFPQWDGQYRAFNLLDNFFNLEVDSENGEHEANQMRLAFYTALLTHVAVLNNVTTIRKQEHVLDVSEPSSSISYSLIPVLVSTDKNIGKSTFMNRLLTSINAGNTAETDLESICDPQKRGRLYHSNHALILDELNPFQVVHNTSTLKAIATQTCYDYDQKYEQIVTLPRKTMIVATTNNPKDDFAIHETDRRLQFINVRYNENRKNADEYPFEQVWAELNHFVQRMPTETIRHLTSWSEELTSQNVSELDDEFKVWLFAQTNILFQPNAFKEMCAQNPRYEHTVSRRKKTGLFITNPYFELRLFDKSVTPLDTQKIILDSLNIKFNVRDNKIVDFSLTALRRRITSFIARQVTGAVRDFETVRALVDDKRVRGYQVNQVHTHTSSNLINKQPIDDRFQKLSEAIMSSANEHTRSTKELLRETQIIDEQFNSVVYSQKNMDQLDPQKNYHVRIQNKNIIEFMTRTPIPNKYVQGFQFVRESQLRGLKYHHYIGLVSDINIQQIDNFVRETNEFSVIYDNALSSSHGDYIFVSRVTDMRLGVYQQLDFDKLEMNAIVPFIAETYNRRLSRDFEEVEPRYQVRYEDIFKE